ncbi:MAG: hypothetical protein LBU91_04830 [Bacteroidales bacterium]|jgi:hypothetical protein|nr:hypothetical protein [Bacteroidales bacterium]
MKITKYLLIILLGTILIAESCRKDPVFNTDPSFRLEFSTDTISFDTIFTSLGSTTLLLKVHNPSLKDIDISNIELLNRQFFKINVDGDTMPVLRNVRLRAKDSMHIFISAMINPDDQNNPFEVLDSIRFSYNNHSDYVILRAFGQNAEYHFPNPNDTLIVPNGEDTVRLPYSVADCSVPWTAGKAHIIYGYLVVKSGDKLVLNAGTHLHFAPNSGLIVAEGATLEVAGTIGNEVIFDGMRMDADYRTITGQWNCIWFLEGSINNKIDWAIIKNGQTGLLIDSIANRFLLSNTIIDNMQSCGISAQSVDIRGTNLQVSNCGDRLMALNGGNGSFEHCTFANYYASTPSSYRKYASILLTKESRSDFTSCIINGPMSDELELDVSNGTLGNHSFDYCHIRTRINASLFEATCVINELPYFTDPLNGNFEINEPDYDDAEQSVVRYRGKSYPTVDYDLKSRLRLMIRPTIGAYEYQAPDILK